MASQRPCIDLSWPLTFRRQNWNWLAIYFHHVSLLGEHVEEMWPF